MTSIAARAIGFEKADRPNKFPLTDKIIDWAASSLGAHEVGEKEGSSGSQADAEVRNPVFSQEK